MIRNNALIDNSLVSSNMEKHQNELREKMQHLEKVYIDKNTDFTILLPTHLDIEKMKIDNSSIDLELGFLPNLKRWKTTKQAY